MKSLAQYILESQNFLVSKHSSKDTFDISKINEYNGIKSLQITIKEYQ